MSSRNLMSRTLKLGASFALAMAMCLARAQAQGNQVVVIYNTRNADSRSVAEHYAEARHVPEQQVLGFDLTSDEVVDRSEFRDRLQEPLIKTLMERGLITLKSGTNLPAVRDSGLISNNVARSPIRYAVLCYGIPLRIAEDSDLRENIKADVPNGLRRNGAAVDSELACLPLLAGSMPLSGPLSSPLYESTNEPSLTPTNGLLMVTRLDGPTAEIARGLVDKAILAETEGLWGRAYFDLRGLTNGPYKLGDDEMRDASEICRKLGYETVVDDLPATFGAGFPLSQVALYAGWYDENVSGPFARPKVEFMPGAFAYHLYSYSADTLRSTDRHWAGPLLAKGVTATMGCVDEPYLQLMPNMAVFFNDFVNRGWTYGEAAYACQRYLSWQTTVIGDPLYRPGGEAQGEKQEKYLEEHHSPMRDWLYLRVINFRLAHGGAVSNAVDALGSLAATHQSAVLSEKLGDLYAQEGRLVESAEDLQQALRSNPSPQQYVRVALALAARLTDLDKYKRASEVYEELLKRVPDYPDEADINRRLQDVESKYAEQTNAEAHYHNTNRVGAATNSPAK